MFIGESSLIPVFDGLYRPCVLHAYAGIEAFLKRVKKFPDWYTLHPQIRDQFSSHLQARSDLREKWDSICEACLVLVAGCPTNWAGKETS